MTYIPPDLRRLVAERAGGCCEYCHISQGDSDISFHIEHIIAVSHGGRTAADNLCLSCVRCNLHKGVNIAGADPETGNPTFIYHPGRQRWDEHFRLDGPFIEPLSPEGRVTTFLLRLNNAERLEERQALVELGHYPCLPPASQGGLT